MTDSKKKKEKNNRKYEGRKYISHTGVLILLLISSCGVYKLVSTLDDCFGVPVLVKEVSAASTGMCYGRVSWIKSWCPPKGNARN